MKARPDLERVVTDWLHDDATTAGSDRVLATTLVRLAGVGQERAPRLLRYFDMNNIAKLAIGVAAVAVVAVVGINLLPGSGGVGSGPAASPSPSPAASPSPSPSPAASPSPSPAAAFPPVGPLAIGTHAAVLDGVPLSFSVPASGWTREAGGYTILKGEYGQPDGRLMNFWSSAPENVYADPCAHTPLSPPPGTTAAGLAAAVAKIPGTDLVSGPSSLTVGGRPAQHVALTIREDIGCAQEDAWLWYDEASGGATGGYRFAALGSTMNVWIVDVDGKLVWFDGETMKGAGPESGQDIQKVIDSISFE